MGEVSVALLGTIEARRDSSPAPVAGRRLQALLAILALDASQAVRADRLIDEIWGGDILADPVNSLQALVSDLRRLLGRDAVIRSGAGYALAVEIDDVDALRLEALVSRGRDHQHTGDHRSSAQAHRDALALVRGPPLVDLADFPFAREAADRLEQIILGAQEGLMDAELAAGRHVEVIVPLTELTRAHSLRERFHAQLILALYRSGRQAESLRAYQAVRTTLIDELGIEPGPELRQLEAAILAHDPALAAPALAAPALVPSPRPSPEGLVGRAAELEQLTADLGEALGGSGRVALVSGEPGIGKTRLVAELADGSRHEGAAVAWGRSHAGRGAPAFWPWSQIVASLVEELELDPIVAALGSRAGIVGRIVPEIHGLVPDLGPPPPVDPETEQFLVGEALARTFRSLAASRPLLLVLDDLHWADPGSLQTLTSLAGAMADAPIMVVATYRDVGVPTSGSLAETLAELARAPMATHLALSGLDLPAVRDLMSRSDLPVTGEVAEAIHRRTQGNPLFLIEMLQLNAIAAVDPLHAVPAGVREVIRQRLALLPTVTLAALGAASVLGTTFDLVTLAGLLNGDRATTLQHLEPAMDAGITAADPPVPGRYRFSHGLVRDTVYEDLGESRRTQLHERAADVLQLVDGDGGAHLVAVAEHRFNALPSASAEAAIDSALRAAHWSQQHVAHQQAVECLQAALTLIPMVAAESRARRELEVHHELTSLILATSGHATPAVAEACARLRELSRSTDDPAVLVPALWRLAMFHIVGNAFDDAVIIGEELLDMASASGDGTPRLAAHLMLGPLHANRGDQQAARRHLDVAADLLRTAPPQLVINLVPETPAVWAATMSSWNLALAGDDDRSAGELSLAEGFADEPYPKVYVTWVGALVAMVQRDLPSTLARCEAGITLAMESGHGVALVPFLSTLAAWASALDGGDHGGALDVLIGAASHPGAWHHVFAALLADAQIAAGHGADARTTAEAGLAGLAPGGARWFESELHRHCGSALALAGDPGAEDAFQRAIDVARSQGAGALEARASCALSELRS